MKLLLSSTIQLALAGIAWLDTSCAFAPLPATTKINGAQFAATLAPEPITENSSDDDNTEGTKPTIEFPPPLTKVQRLERAAKFWSSAIPIVLSYYSKSAELLVKEAFTGVELTEDEEQSIWNEQHSKGAKTLADTITSLKGFYVKTAQIIASRKDLFPEEYTEALSDFTDNVDPLPVDLIKAVVEKELLVRGERFEDIFETFDEHPLGSASIAQVHRAVLTEKYGSKEVAVKVQRPSIESKLMGDIANLKTLAKTFSETLPLDYYTVFCELEKQLADEFNFVAEAVAMDRIYETMTKDENGYPCESPVVMPRPVPGLVSRRVLVMDYLDGVPLSRAAEEMLKKGIKPDSPESQLFGRKLLKSLTEVFGRCILETGFFHADPHPGNIFVLEDGRIGLIDFGQVKQISGRERETLSKVMIALDDRVSDDNPSDLENIGNLALELGVELADDAPAEGPAAVAMWLFDGSVENLPGGYDKGELSPNSPVKALKSFPQDLVLVGRSTILIKGLSSRLGIPWSLSQEWAPVARRVLEGNTKQTVEAESKSNKIRMKDVMKLLKTWGRGKASRAVTKLPSPVRTRVAAIALKLQKRREAKESKRRT
jgi:aarF domain-containing kinase